jgi:hypothetical protein
VSHQSSRRVGRVPGCGECGRGEGARHRRAISVAANPDVSPGPVPRVRRRPGHSATRLLPILPYPAVSLSPHSLSTPQTTAVGDNPRRVDRCSSARPWASPGRLRRFGFASAASMARIAFGALASARALRAAVRNDRRAEARPRMLVLTIVGFSGGNRPGADPTGPLVKSHGRQQPYTVRAIVIARRGS